MKLKTSEISITPAQRDKILGNWPLQKGATFNLEILDSEIKDAPTELKLDLRLPYQGKGTTNHMLIKSKIAFDGDDDKLKMVMNSEINKPLFVAAILGILSALLFLVLYSNFVYFILIASIISVILYTYFHRQLVKTGKACLEELKQNHL